MTLESVLQLLHASTHPRTFVYPHTCAHAYTIHAHTLGLFMLKRHRDSDNMHSPGVEAS